MDGAWSDRVQWRQQQDGGTELSAVLEDPWQTLPLPLSAVMESEPSPEVASVSPAFLQKEDR